MHDLLAVLQKRVVVCEGAMGTMLTAQGVHTRTTAEVNLTHPEIVSRIHQAYQQAGAQVFQTNTFAANPHMLERAGLTAQGPEIWSAGVKLCREAVGPDAWVAATGGPTGGLLEPLGDLTAGDVTAAFRQQFEVMLCPQVDFVLLEGFESLDEATLAVQAVRALSDEILIAATLSFSSATGRTSMGNTGEQAVIALREAGANIIGAACGMPEATEIAIQQMGQAGAGMMIAQPNAGMPQVINKETVFSATPQEMGEQAARLIGWGVRLVGSCCGSTPEHTRQIARAASAA